MKKTQEKKEIRKDVEELLLRFNFTRNDLPEERQKEYKGYIATYTVKIQSSGSEKEYILICSFFDGIRFAVMDKDHIMALVSFKAETPIHVLEPYITKCANFFSL